MKIKRTARIFLFTLFLVCFIATIVSAQEDNIGVFRPSNGNWYLDYDLDGVTEKTVQFGMNGDKPVAGDFNRDGTTDIGVFRYGEWIFDYGIDGTVNRRFNWGLSTDVPLTGDFNNDGTTDIGVFRSGEWILDYGIDGTVNRRFNYGLSTDKPIVGNFNNDGTMDIGVFRSGEWILDYGMDRIVDRRFNWGLSTDNPVAGDFNNDGITDIGVFRSGQWILDYGIDGTVDRRVTYGGATDIPVVGKWIPSPVPQTRFYVYAEGVGKYNGHQIDLFPGNKTPIEFYNFINGKCGAGSVDPNKCWYGSKLFLDDDAGSKHWNYFEQAGSYIENADFAMFVGHGSNTKIYFGTQNTTLELNRANMIFGGNRLKWVTLDSCDALNQSSYTNWETVFNGVHIVNGYDTHGSLKLDQGVIYAAKLTGSGGGNNRKSIRIAWMETLQETILDANYKGAWMWADPCGNDYLPGFGDYCVAPVKDGSGNYNIHWDNFDCSYP